MTPLPPCVRPRRRFVLWFLAVCMLVLLCGLAVGCIRYEVKGEFLVEAPVLLLLPYAMLALPCRSSSGTLIQLVGLVFPLFSALAAITFCWLPLQAPNPAQSYHNQALSYMMLVGWWSMLGMYLYPLAFGVGLLVHWCYRRVKSQN